MNKLFCCFVCLTDLLLSACEQTTETPRHKDNTATSEQLLEENTRQSIQAEPNQEPSKQSTQQQILKHPTQLDPDVADRPSLKLDLDNLAVPDLSAGQHDRSAIIEAESAGESQLLDLGKSNQKRLNITGDVTFAEDADDIEIRMDDIIERIDGAEVQLEYKF